jgi:Zn-dependent protease
VYDGGMSPTQKGSVRLCRVAGLTVFLHWSWFAFALWYITAKNGKDSSIGWNALLYFSLLVLVLLNALGRSLACRSVGGYSSCVVLWPLGSLTDTIPPARPGATLWTVSAGSLTSIALMPVLLLLVALSMSNGWPQTFPNVDTYLRSLLFVNSLVLIVNLLPIYPLDGGQIIQTLLWFRLGRARSQFIAAAIGLVLGGCLLAVLLWLSFFLGQMTFILPAVLCAFLLLSCWRAMGQARAMAYAEQIARRPGFACPSCSTEPPLGRFWTCPKCQSAFDTFQTAATCPICATEYPNTRCLDCGAVSHVNEWTEAPPVQRQM